MVRLAIFLLAKRWGWLGVGVLLVIIGAVVFSTGHTIKPVEVDGTFVNANDAIVDTSNGGTYDHSEIKLNETNTVYTFNKDDLHPTWPGSFIGGGKVSLWVDSGTTNVVAIQTYDENDQNPTKYTTDLYDHPEHGVSNEHDAGIGFGIFALPFLAIGLAWPIFPWGKKKQQPVPVVAGYNSALAGQMGYPQQPGFPQQPGYPQYPAQPAGYSQQPQYPAQPGAYPQQPGAYPQQPAYPQLPQQPQQPQYPGQPQPPAAPYGQQPDQGPSGWPRQ